MQHHAAGRNGASGERVQTPEPHAAKAIGVEPRRSTPGRAGAPAGCVHPRRFRGAHGAGGSERGGRAEPGRRSPRRCNRSATPNRSCLPRSKRWSRCSSRRQRQAGIRVAKRRLRLSLSLLPSREDVRALVELVSRTGTWKTQVGGGFLGRAVLFGGPRPGLSRFTGFLKCLGRGPFLVSRCRYAGLYVRNSLRSRPQESRTRLGAQQQAL